MRVLCVEDNPIILLHVISLLEDLGHEVVASFASFSDLKSGFEHGAADLALMDIDLADGRTGPDAAKWLLDRSIPSIFVTGQEQLALDYKKLAIGSILKPVSETEVGRLLRDFEGARDRSC